ncbi:MAG: hypothetical protein WDA07_08235 [Leucobacter sp.]
MTLFRALAIAIPCGWLLAALGFLLLVELEDTTVGFDAPHVKASLRLVK